jgi:hypothetical protein
MIARMPRIRLPFTGAGAYRYADFLPDAQGVANRRHSPVAGVLILAVAAAFGSMIGWSAWAEVEQVVRAPGRVAPAGQVKLINHPHGGRVAEVHVGEGERVVQGQPLVTFDAEEAGAELAELRGRLEVLSARAARTMIACTPPLAKNRLTACPSGCAASQIGPNVRTYSAIERTFVGRFTGPWRVAPTKAVTEVETPTMVRAPDGTSCTYTPG